MANKRTDLADRVVVVTGGARGIGAAIASALVSRGCKVVIGDLDADLVAAVADDLGPTCQGLQLDVTDASQYTQFLDTVEAEIGPLDILINNAGIMPVGRIEDETEASTDRQLAVNLRAVIHGSREAVRRMKPRGSGHIINVSSSAGKVPVPGAATYTATKWGVVGFSDSLRLELHGTGVEVSCILPGLVRTDLAAGLADNPVFKSLGPDDIAAAVVGVIERPRFEVFVPKSLGFAARTMAIAPKGFNDWLQRALKADDHMLKAAAAPERRFYEDRVADSD